MSEQLTFYKLFVEKQYNIEIPIIQRDYAQGRQSAKEIRNDFLDALYTYLTEGVPFRDLDFIYGDIDGNNNFIPLDGQQRLTTLFLLHWYLAVKENRFDELKQALTKDTFSRFTYKTRQSATDFCNALFRNPFSLAKLLSPDDEKENALSKTIRDSYWYFLSWDYDPTIQSMLCMLDAIDKKFKNAEGFYGLLINTENPVITFQFLPLKDYGLTDDLYIKMNSRGKPLTKFENFKAKIEQHLENFNSKVAYSPSIKDYFAQKIDTEWADLFWTYRDKKENVFDKQMMHFISAIAINHYSLTQNEPKKYIDNQNNLPLDFYLRQNEQFITTLIDTLDLISNGHKYRQYLPVFHYYDEIDTFDKIINNKFSDTGYAERIKFFAYYAYLCKWKVADGLQDWMRVMVNLIENTTPYNNETEYVNSLRAIQRLLPHSNSILEYIITDDNIKGFNPTQIKEEQIKAHLILKDDAWAERIYKAEKHPYFKGQITFALAFSQIESYYDENGQFDWNETDQTNFQKEFDRYIDLVFALFTEGGLRDEAKLNHRLHRAILTKGDYLLFAKKNYSFLVDTERDVSWKRFLLGDGYRSNKRNFFKQLISDSLFDPSDLSSLELICSTASNLLTDWRIKFVLYPELLAYLGKDKYIRHTDDDIIYLLRGVKMNGEHTELYTYSLYMELKSELTPAPFNDISYYKVNTDKEEPYIFFNGFKFKENELELDIYYEGHGIFKLKLFDQNKEPIGHELLNLLIYHNFVEQTNYLEKLLPENEVKEKLRDILGDFSSAISID
ncbi:DUF262 domain-containing protein [Lacibacter sediminis]|uniref:DUF262 domain-containing protein n=1 Tax=Lacibacter sediminis TaxID=2760713 RepID=A0A7G5XFP1_9BACT|nr:DUF262 domain-containing protein [Lacibacter sediminis]QNA44294.1 DUF262 domain-containing protein [Lacibacter sediminis]